MHKCVFGGQVRTDAHVCTSKMLHSVVHSSLGYKSMYKWTDKEQGWKGGCWMDGWVGGGLLVSLSQDMGKWVMLGSVAGATAVLCYAVLCSAPEQLLIKRRHKHVLAGNLLISPSFLDVHWIDDPFLSHTCEQAPHACAHMHLMHAPAAPHDAKRA